MAKTFTYENERGGREAVAVRVSAYANGNLAVKLECRDAECCGMPYATLTVNIGAPLPSPCAHIDTNNLGDAAVVFLVKNGLAKVTRFHGKSGYCTYPMLKFDPQELAKADPDGWAAYENVRNVPALAI